MMKKIVALLLVMLLPVFALVGCNDSDGGKTTYTVTFVQAEQENIVRTVEKGKALANVPSPAPVTGHDVAWDVTDFSNVSGDLTVNAVATPKTYTIYYTVVEGLQSKPITLEKTSQQVTYGQAFTLISASYVEGDATYVLTCWLNNGEEFSSDIWTYTEDITLVTGKFRNTKDVEWSS